MRRIGVTRRHHGRLLRRQEQLVGVLRLLGVPALRPRNARIMDGGRLKWEKEGRPLTATCRATPPAITRRRSATTRRIRAFRDEVLRHVEQGAPLIDVRSPAEYSGERLHMPEYPNEGALRGGHIPGAANVPWARAVNPEDGTFKSAAELRSDLRGGGPPRRRRRRRRLLPHRRAQQPHLVRAHQPARLPPGAQLRRQLDGVGQPGGGADREVGAQPPAAAPAPAASAACWRRAKAWHICSMPSRPRFLPIDSSRPKRP